MKKVVVTGGSGFLGGAVARYLDKSGFSVSVVSRRFVPDLPDTVTSYVLQNGIENAVWSSSIEDQDIVIHCAGRAHILRENTKDPLLAFREANVNLTLDLARKAAAAKVKRFVFISSIGVNGLESVDRPFEELDTEKPYSPYTQSKFEAERGLWEISKNTGLEVVVIRPPLIYGPNAPGNFEWLVKMVRMGVPLPFKLVNNRRSLISLKNIVDFISRCAVHPNAANQLFLVSDGRDLSTQDIVLNLSKELGIRPRFVNIPPFFMIFILSALGQKKMAKSLYGNLQVNINKSKKILDWDPPQDIESGFRSAVK
jgi:nucleoside-diphosphate-sugar epimerase